MNLLPGEIIETGAQTKVKLDGEGIAISAIPTQESDMGRRVNVGVRPEDMVKADGLAIIDGTVDMLEALGEVTLLYFVPERGQEPLIAKLPGIHSDLRGQVVKLTADPNKVHLFADGVSMRPRD
jgi:alpha-glucoside transport system ATP-binding protein